MEGALSKWTNVMKGWQFRWFILVSLITSILNWLFYFTSFYIYWTYYRMKLPVCLVTTPVRRRWDGAWGEGEQGPRSEGLTIVYDLGVSDSGELWSVLMMKTTLHLLSLWTTKHFTSKQRILRKERDGLEPWRSPSLNTIRWPGGSSLDRVLWAWRTLIGSWGRPIATFRCWYPRTRSLSSRWKMRGVKTTSLSLKKSGFMFK